jgi:acyl carrier protein
MNNVNVQSMTGGPSAQAAPDRRDAVLALVITTVAEMVEDWDRAFADPITSQTLLVGDLGFQSIDIVVLSGALSQSLDRRDIPFERLLLDDGKPVPDLRLGMLADFLWQQTQSPAR